MTVLTLDGIRDYCNALEIGMKADYNRRLYFERCAECRVYVGRFADAASAAFDMAETMVAPERGDFKGALVWLTGRTSRFTNCDSAFARVRQGFGIEAPVEETPGHLFGPTEFADAVILMGFLMNFGWDAVWAPAHGEYLMAVNHDNFIDFAVRGGNGRWDTDRHELLENLDFRHSPQMSTKYCWG